MSDFNLPGFEVLEKLGQGGMATVWKARQISLDRTVAIKILLSRMSRDQSDVDRFLAEARSAAKLKHPGIVQVYDANVDQNLYYFVMEHIGGYTVSDWIKRKGHLSETDALLVAQSVADALGYAWESQRLIHCDIKPDNVMVDSDGTLKVTDLGLSRTIQAAYDNEFEDEVMGTPAYMSPEQVLGKSDLDFKSDIYSLGAMLFHMATGRLMFEGQDEEKVMEMQVSGVEEDPHDVNPQLTMPICWLIEKMLIKDRAQRYGSWSQVQDDILRVKRGVPPAGHKPKEGLSSVKRSKLRNHPDSFKTHNQHTVKNSHSSRSAVIIMLVVLACAAAAGVWYYSNKQQEKIRELEAQRIVVQRNESKEAQQEAERKAKEVSAREMFEFAEKWAASNPGRYDEACERFKSVASQTKGTKYSLMADDKASEIDRAKNDECSKIFGRLALDAAKLESAGDLIGAAKIYTDYKGTLAGSTEARRTEAADKLMARHDKLISEKKVMKDKADRIYHGMVKEVAAVVLQKGAGNALVLLSSNANKAEFTDYMTQISEMKQLLHDASRIDDDVLQSFADQAGADVQIETTTGSKKMTIKEVIGGKIIAEQKKKSGAAEYSSTCSLALGDIALKERLIRMGDEAKPHVALAKGLLLFSNKQTEEAKKCFAATGVLLSKPILDNISESSVNASGRQKNGTNTRDVSGPEVKRRQVFEHVVHADYQGMLDDQDQILEALYRLNPDFPSGQIRMSASNGDGKASKVLFYGAGGALLRDIAPLSALTSLKVLIYSAEPGAKSRLSDISCLKGLDMKVISLPNTRISDITALNGMTLDELNLSGTDVSDLSVLKTMDVKSLSLNNIRASDFSFIQGLGNLTELSLANCLSKDLRFLKGLKLDSLDLSGVKVMDYFSMSGLDLKKLVLTKSGVKSLDFLRAMARLESLDLGETQVASVSYLKGVPLKELNLNNTSIKDFSILKDMPLTVLNLSGTAFGSIDLVKGKKLESLDISKTKVIDISGLSGMPLAYLNVENTYVSNVRALKDAPLKIFMCRGARINDYSPLRDSSIESLWIDEPFKQRELLRSLSSLKELNGRVPLELLNESIMEDNRAIGPQIGTPFERVREGGRRPRHAPVK